MVKNGPNGRKWWKMVKNGGPDLKRARRTGLSARRAQRTKSRGPKGLQLEVGARRAPRLLVLLYVLIDESSPKIQFATFLHLGTEYEDQRSQVEVRQNPRAWSPEKSIANWDVIVNNNRKCQRSSNLGDHPPLLWHHGVFHHLLVLQEGKYSEKDLEWKVF